MPVLLKCRVSVLKRNLLIAITLSVTCIIGIILGFVTYRRCGDTNVVYVNAVNYYEKIALGYVNAFTLEIKFFMTSPVRRLGICMFYNCFCFACRLLFVIYKRCRHRRCRVCNAASIRIGRIVCLFFRYFYSRYCINGYIGGYAGVQPQFNEKK